MDCHWNHAALVIQLTAALSRNGLKMLKQTEKDHQLTQKYRARAFD